MTNALYEALEAERERNRIVGNVMNEVAYIQNQVNEGKFKPGEYREAGISKTHLNSTVRSLPR